MPYLFIGTLLIAIFAGCSSPTKDQLNLDFEDWNGHIPAMWKASNPIYGEIKKDSVYTNSGKFSLNICKGAQFSKYLFKIEQSIVLPSIYSSCIISGKVRSRNIKSGYAGLFYKVVSKTGDILKGEDFSQNSISGTTEWREVSLNVEFDKAEAQSIILGAWFLGDGDFWVDDLRIKSVPDGKHISDISPAKEYGAIASSSIQKASNSISSELTISQIDKIARFIQYWGFLKYYHPNVEKYDINMDSLFFENLPKLMADTNRTFPFPIMVDILNDMKPLSSYVVQQFNDTEVREYTSFNEVFDLDTPDSIHDRLKKIKDYKLSVPHQKYMIQDASGRVKITNENEYEREPFPDKAVRLLALSRYWNIINYYYPYKNMISGNWLDVLYKYVPLMTNATNDLEYTKAIMRLMSLINDGHADIMNYNAAHDSILGGFRIPIAGKFIDNQLFVKSIFSDDNPTPLRVGDRIVSIDSVPITKLLEEYLPFISASNLNHRKKKLISSKGFLSRSHFQQSMLGIERNGVNMAVVVNNISTLNPKSYEPLPLATPAFELIQDSIGYINTSKLKEEYFSSINSKLNNTKYLILDLRCYPSVFMPFSSYAKWLIPKLDRFAITASSSKTAPGTFVYSAFQTTGYYPTSAQGIIPYKGRVIILVDENSISQAEYTAMAFRIAENALIAGQQTAGADGDVVKFWLPGNILTCISGIGVYYPDKSETQGPGVKIDIPVTITRKGVADGVDEILTAAIGIIGGK